jgi:hypothetical protein
MQVNDLSMHHEQNTMRTQAHRIAQVPSSFADTLETSVKTQSNPLENGGTITLNFHDMTGDQFLAVEQTLYSEGKSTQTVLSPVENNTTPTDQIAMYGSWASAAAAKHDPKGEAGFLNVQKDLLAQGDSAGNITVDASTYNTALAAFTGTKT